MYLVSIRLSIIIFCLHIIQIDYSQIHLTFKNKHLLQAAKNQEGILHI